MKRLLTIAFLWGARLCADDLMSDFAPDSVDFKGQLLHMMGTLVLVLILALGTVWFLKKFMRSRTHAHNLSYSIKVMERRSLGPKSALYLVNVLGKTILISESAGGVRLITELPEDCKNEAIDKPVVGNSGKSFMDFLKRIKT